MKAKEESREEVKEDLYTTGSEASLSTTETSAISDSKTEESMENADREDHLNYPSLDRVGHRDKKFRGTQHDDSGHPPPHSARI